jgi:hypothetical protein
MSGALSTTSFFGLKRAELSASAPAAEFPDPVEFAVPFRDC